MTTEINIPPDQYLRLKEYMPSFISDHGYTFAGTTKNSIIYKVRIVEVLTDREKRRLLVDLMMYLSNPQIPLGYEGEPLTHAKSRYMEVVDRTTNHMIEAGGFQYAGLTFGLSIRAQSKWMGLVLAKDGLTYPFRVPTRDNDASYDIADSTEVTTIFGTIVGTIDGTLAVGNVEKEKIEAAPDKAAARAIAQAFMELHECHFLEPELGP